jgi:uncharacterized UBP type Zn finger protein
VADSCEHLEAIDSPARKPVAPSGHGCKECLQAGDVWVHLRLCMTCGHVGCCDSSPNKHATKHFHQTKHPAVRSFEPGEDWAWCFVHERFADGVRALGGEAASRHYSPPGAQHP